MGGVRAEGCTQRGGSTDSGGPRALAGRTPAAHTLIDAQLTSTDGDSHLLSLGEFAALYLSVWSAAVWGEEVIGAGWAPDASKPEQQEPLRWDRELPVLVKGKPETGAIVLTGVQFPKTIAGHLYESLDKAPEAEGRPTSARTSSTNISGACAGPSRSTRSSARTCPRCNVRWPTWRRT